MKKNKVAFFPYGSEKNPYQLLIKEAVEKKKNFEVEKIAPQKLFPYWFLKSSQINIIHHFWPHDFYQGKNKFLERLKQFSYLISLSVLNNKKIIYSADNLVGHDHLNFENEIYWIQKLINKANAIIFTTNASKEIFLKHYKVKNNCELAIVPHVSYFNYYLNEISRNEAREKLNIPTSSKVLLSLGRVSPYKGTVELLKIFKKINKENTVLVICGSCTDFGYNHQIKKEIDTITNYNCKVIYINSFIEDDDLQIYFNATDGVILNYKDVPMNPGSLVLAMGFGCSIIAPNEGAIPEIVPKECLFGFDSRNILSLESALLSFFECGNLIALGEIAKKHVHENHSSEKVGKILSELYDKLIIESEIIN